MMMNSPLSRPFMVEGCAMAAAKDFRMGIPVRLQ